MNRFARLLKTFTRGAGAAVMLGALAVPVAAQDYPSKPIRIVLEFPAGQGGDTMARLASEHVSKAIGQPVVIDNKPGAGGVVAALEAMKAEPDGYTLLEASPNALVVRRFMTKDKAPFDVLKDFTPITALHVARSVVVVGANSPFKTYADLVEYAKANPGKLRYGTSGHGSQNHLAQEEVNQILGLSMVHVPYQGMLAPLTDAMEGRIDFAYSIMPIVAPREKEGQVRPLAMVATKPYPIFPDAPPLSQLVPGWAPPPSWAALFGPANLPPAIATRIRDEFAKAMELPEVVAFMEKGYFEKIANTPAEFAADISKEIDLVGDIVKKANIQPE